MTDIASTDHTQPYLNMFREYVREEKTKSTFQMEVLIHTKEKDLGNDEDIYLHDLTILRNYETNIGDHIEAQISIPGGTFIDDVFPYLEHCEVTIRTKKQYTKGADKKPFVSTIRYKAIYLKDKNTNVPNAKQYSKHDMNQRQSFIVALQLVDKSVEALRIKTTSGSFSVKGAESVNDTVRAILSAETAKVMVDNKPAIDFIQVCKTDNPAKMESLTMPSFSRVIEIPDYVQEKSIGVYTSGLGCYIQKCALEPGKVKTGMWVYPLYGVKRDSADTLEIYCPTQESSVTTLPGAIYKDGRYIMLAYKPAFKETVKEAGVMNKGSGFRSADASKMMDKPITVTKKGPVFERNKLNTEVIYKEREDGINFAVNKGVYFNNFVLASEVMKDKCDYVTMQVANLDHDIIRPGMNIYLSTLNVKQMQDKEEKREKRVHNCNMLQAFFVYTNGNPNPVMSTANRFTEFTCHATLKLCVEEQIDDEK